MKVYLVEWKYPAQGEYVPPGPVGEGDYYRDLVGSDVVTCSSANRARSLVGVARPNAVIKKTRLLGEA